MRAMVARPPMTPPAFAPPFPTAPSVEDGAPAEGVMEEPLGVVVERRSGRTSLGLWRRCGRWF